MIDSGQFNAGDSRIEADHVDDIDHLHDVAASLAPTETSLAARMARSTLFDMGQIDVDWEAESGTLWAFMTPSARPNSNLGLIRDVVTWQDETRRIFGTTASPLQFMVLGSRFPGVFNLGGDLEMFADCIQRRDRATLLKYGIACVEIVDRIWRCNDMDIINIGLAQGDALGGGLEALMCFDVIIAERQARFGLPEVMFGLFPGMGAHAILSRRVGPRTARQIITEGKVYSAQEMYDMGIVTVLADEGQGEAVAREWIADHRPHHAGYVGINRAERRVNPMTLAELTDIVETWTDAALRLEARDLRMMRRLASAQTRLRA